MVAAQGDFMTLPSLRQRLKSGTPFLAPFSIIPAVEVVEAIGLAGFDGVILDLEHGRVVERGTHAELHAARGRYREMYDRQHGLEQDLFLAPGEGEKPEEEKDAAPASAGARPRSAPGLGLLAE